MANKQKILIVDDDENIPSDRKLQNKTWFQRFSTIIAGIVIVSLIAYVLVMSRSPKTEVNTHVELKLLPFQLVLHKSHNRSLFTFACCNFGISYVIQTVIGKKFLEDKCNKYSLYI